MPMLGLKCSKEVPENLLADLSAAVAETIGKPEKYVMVTAEKTTVMMSGTAGDAAFIDVRSIGGLDGAVNAKLTGKIGILLEQHLGIAPDRVYVTFQSVERDHWGWNKATFG